MNADAHEGLLTKNELAARLRLTPRGIDMLVLKRRIPVLKINHKVLRFDYARVLGALNRCEVKEVGA